MDPKPASDQGLLTLHPAVPVWPSNLLRFHLEFHAAAPVNEVLHGLRLLRSDGVDATGALVDLDHGLWSPDERWLTVLFHPGRVKAGLLAREQLGPALVEGEHYRLQINLPGSLSYAESFAVGPSEATAINPHLWTLAAHAPDQILLHLDRPVDALSAYSHLRLIDSQGKPIAAPNRVVAQTIHFTRAPRAVALRIDPRFEDPCGNRCARPFEATAQDDSWSPDPVILPL